MGVCVWAGLSYLAVAHLPQSEGPEELPHLDAVSRLWRGGVEGEHVQQLRRARLVGLPAAAALLLALLPATLPLRLLLPVLAKPKRGRHTGEERVGGWMDGLMVGVCCLLRVPYEFPAKSVI